ncbi:gap junction beta-7 protein [Muntiacus reevesi]|uniref:gap junction beta-7 protein n=1 Tax=Muntiacus reevesi TaxID=9886 RepID=UPI00330708F2
MSWMLLRDLLRGVNTYSAGPGRVWLAVLFVFRLLVYLVAAGQVWKEERREFECNVRQPGCASVCFDYFFPISQVRLWALQLILVSAPSLLVVLHAAYLQGREKQHRRKLCVSPGAVGAGLWCPHLVSLVVETGLEIGFLALFYKLYGGFRAPRLLKCGLRPCPSAVDCFVSKPTEKTVFTLFLVGASCLCVVLNVTELSFLVLRCFIKCCLQKHSTRLPSSACERRKLRPVAGAGPGAPALLRRHSSEPATSRARGGEATLLCDTRGLPEAKPAPPSRRT